MPAETTDEYGDPHYGVRLNYAAQQVDRAIADSLPRTRLGLEDVVRNLRANRGVIDGALAADLIERALALA